MTTSAAKGAKEDRPLVEYFLYWASPEYARRIGGEMDAIRQLPLPYKCSERDEALGHARLRREAGMVPLLIEGSDGTVIDQVAIEHELKVRAVQLRDRPRIR